MASEPSDWWTCFGRPPSLLPRDDGGRKEAFVHVTVPSNGNGFLSNEAFLTLEGAAELGWRALGLGCLPGPPSPPHDRILPGLNSVTPLWRFFWASVCMDRQKFDRCSFGFILGLEIGPTQHTGRPEAPCEGQHSVSSNCYSEGGPACR